jgi:hypothetical protein
MVQYDTSDSRLRDRGFACFLLDISPHLAPHLNVDGRINSGCSPAYHRARTALTSENSNFVRSVSYVRVKNFSFTATIYSTICSLREREREGDFESRAFGPRDSSDRESTGGIPRGPRRAAGVRDTWPTCGPADSRARKTRDE